MWENILAILVILLLSAFFRQKTNNSFNSQMLFILLSLVGLVFYKIMYLNKMKTNKDILVLQNKEPFINSELNDAITNFEGSDNALSTASSGDVSPSEKHTELEGKILDLELAIDDIKKNKILDSNKSINSKDMIQKQLYQIKQLEGDIQNLYETQAKTNTDINTPSIPLYSSCISTADGSLTVNTNSTENEGNPSTSINLINFLKSLQNPSKSENSTNSGNPNN